MAQASDHEKAVYDWIDANVTLGDFTLHEGPPRDHHEGEIVTVHTSGGNIFYGVNGDEADKNPRLQVLVRAHKTNRDGGHAMARTIYEELKRADIAGYTGPWMLQPGPLPFQRDGDENHWFSVNLRIHIRE